MTPGTVVRDPLVPGTVNFRAVDLGTATTPAGERLRDGVLFRSDALHALGDAGRGALRDLGVVRVIDLRSDEEVAEAPDDITGTGIALERVPIMAGSLHEALAHLTTADIPDLQTVYAAMLRDSGRTLGRAVALTAGGGPTVLHCTAGKDRTGLATALVLLAIGFGLDEIAADYARTEANLAGAWLDAMSVRIARLGVPLEGPLRRLVGESPERALRGALDEVVLRDGSAAGYLDAIGVDAAVRARLRDALLTPPLPATGTAPPAVASSHQDAAARRSGAGR